MQESTFTRRKMIFNSLKGLGGLSIASVGLASLSSSCKSVKDVIRMQSPWINDAEFIGYFIAIENDYFKNQNLEFEYLSGGPEIVSDSVLIAKRCEIALTTPDVTINAIAKDNAPFKIVGAQYQKSPLGIVSLEKNGISTPNDLIGKRIAVPPANQITIKAFLSINNIKEKDVQIVPYQYDPKPLLNGEVDATLDFVTNVPFTIELNGEKPSSFLLYDYGFQIFNDTVVVRNDYLKSNRSDISKWLKASRLGWDENFQDTEKYPKKFEDTYFQGTGRSVENEIYFNKAQKELIKSENGIFSMTEEAIEKNILSLEKVGIKARRDMFVNDLI